MNSNAAPVVSVVIVSFNTCRLLHDCLTTLYRELADMQAEVFVVDNTSTDGSQAMVKRDFPDVRLIESDCNLGFAGGNNRAFPLCTGKYIVLLNSDAFPEPGALRRAVEHMESHPVAGLGGARLIGRDRAWQPSGRQFPSLLNEFLSLSGLSIKLSKSRIFGRQDRTWSDPATPAQVDWVPGAFSIVRRTTLEKTGYFDESFFLYYEEVDLCQRIKRAGFDIWYWPDIVVVHYGGESSKTVSAMAMSNSGAQLMLWRMRSQLLYYRKYYGSAAWLVKRQEQWWHRVRAWKNARSVDTARLVKARDSQKIVELLDRAWSETRGGRISPPRPW